VKVKKERIVWALAHNTIPKNFFLKKKGQKRKALFFLGLVDIINGWDVYGFVFVIHG
jgi:hypothetical protein